MLRHPKERPSPNTGGVSRRDFLVKGTAGIPIAAALLSACSKPGTTGPGGSGATGELPLARPDAPVTLPMYPDNPAIADGLKPEAGPLKLYNWDQYIYKKVVEQFGQDMGVKVEISTFNNMDEALNKIRSSPLDFDVFFPTIDVLGKMAAFKLLQPLNHSYLPNLPKNVWPEFAAPDKPFYDVGQGYTVPYTIYTTGIGWRNDLVDEKDAPPNLDNPYDIFQNEKYKGKVGIYDDAREAIAMALLRNGGIDVNTGDTTQLSKATEWLSSLIKKTNPALDINGTYEDLPKGIFYVHQAWSGDMTSAPYYGKENAAATAPLLSYWWPKNQKGVIGNDTMAILKSAKNPVLAHMFLNYLLDFDTAMKNFSWVGYQPPQNDAPPERFSDPNFKWAWVVYPNLENTISTPDDLDKGYQLLELSPQVDAIWHDDWEEFTSGV